MKIVVLDGHAANPGDLSWDELETCGELQVYPRTAPHELLERAQGAEILLTNKVLLLQPELEQLPALRYVGVLATGVNVVDVDCCRKRHIAVANIPGYSSASVCQMTFALMLGLAHQLRHHDELVHNRAWSRSAEPCFIDRPLLELAGLNLGLIGFGQIAREVARVAQAFGMQLQVYTTHPENYREAWPQVRFVGLDQLVDCSDLISLHCPLNPRTRTLVDADFITRMKPGALLINTARGLLVDEMAVAAALKDGLLAGYGADVMGTEPPPADHPLLDAPNALLTSHIAWGTGAARQRLMRVASENVKSFMAGGRLNRID
ncbi:D-2-hydroxyacid dehydrogenase [Geopsychrobacter electrodiphilus]|uniref:D-2-hydroxyacid dehydrogenase n=1 Tax=Geopsychrobacter electrodiphilus TaxID=225196 RepID=UPI000367EF3D|nr:D-2-hydroxyacid dehydrogenase [Geopsychrobacter electrodiphilus]